MNGRLERITRVAGGPRTSLCSNRHWDTDGTLYFISDRSDWWNLYRWTGKQIEPVLTLEAEVGGPCGCWVYQTTHSRAMGARCLRYGVKAQDKLGVLDLRSRKLHTLDVPFTSLSSITLLSHDTAVAIAASSTQEPAVVSINLRNGQYAELRAPGAIRLEAASISRAEPIEFPTDGGSIGHAFFYRPAQRRIPRASG